MIYAVENNFIDSHTRFIFVSITEYYFHVFRNEWISRKRRRRKREKINHGAINFSNIIEQQREDRAEARNVTRKRHTLVAIDSDTDASGEPFLPETLFSWLLKSMEKKKKLLVKLNSCGGSGTLPSDLTSDKIGHAFQFG